MAVVLGAIQKVENIFGSKCPLYTKYSEPTRIRQESKSIRDIKSSLESFIRLTGGLKWRSEE